jgi:predicted MPP superfamily phosphohydrolase
LQKPDFSHRQHFPGTHGHPFDVVLRVARTIQRLPVPVFAGLLLVLALAPTLGRWLLTLGLWAFCLADWALVAALPRAGKSYGPAKPPVLLLAILRAPFALLPWPWALAAQLTGTGLVLYGFWIEPHRVQLTREALHSPKLNPAAPPLRLLHLGDLHVERITDRERQVLRLARETAPDVIVFSGDLLNLSNVRDPEAWAAVREIFRELAAPLGVFVVSGSPAVDEPDVIPEVLDGLPLRWLRDERVTLAQRGQSLELIGLSCTHKPFVDGPRLAAILDHSQETFRLLLYHSPDLAPDAADLGIDLQLSGHTHGGQVRLPLVGALYAGSLYGKRFDAGRQMVGRMTLYVTRGIGMEGEGAPRLRFLCPPEVTLWEIGA